MSSSIIYRAGGTLPPDSETYIARQADRELLQLCTENTFAYVLTARQMGKSSLMERTKRRLREKEYVTATADLSLIGTTTDAEKWYYGVVQSISDELNELHGWEFDIRGWWQEHDYLGLAQRMVVFFDQVILTQFAHPVIIFVDEIDYTREKPFTDDFYAAIRSIYNARPKKSAFHRLSFVLIGVAIPSELISDPDITPFNIGQAVILTDFTAKEALPLLKGLKTSSVEAEQILEWVLEWTGGHPYLTQRVFYQIAKEEYSPQSITELDRIIGRCFFDRDMADKDTHLMWLEMWLTKSQSRSVDPEAVLILYEQILHGRAPVTDDEDSLVHSHLKLSGIVRRQDDALVVRNRIYEEKFNRQWLYRQLRLVREEKHQPQTKPPVASLATESIPSQTSEPTLSGRSSAPNTSNQPRSESFNPPASKQNIHHETSMPETPAPRLRRPEAQPITQGRPYRRSRWPEWMQQLPYMNFMPGPDPNYQLIDEQDMRALLKGTDPSVIERIREDLQFLDFEALRLFRERDYEAKRNQNRYRAYRVSFLLLSALAALMGIIQAILFRNNPNLVPVFSFILVVIMLFTTYLSTVSGRESPVQLWLANRRRAEALRREYFRFLLNVPPYDQTVGYSRKMLLSKRTADINRGVDPEDIF